MGRVVIVVVVIVVIAILAYLPLSRRRRPQRGLPDETFRTGLRHS
jgi:hypothetical protein